MSGLAKCWLVAVLSSMVVHSCCKEHEYELLKKRVEQLEAAAR